MPVNWVFNVYRCTNFVFIIGVIRFLTDKSPKQTDLYANFPDNLLNPVEAI